MTRLMSFWTRPTVAAKNAVVAPMKVTTAERRRRQLEQRRQPRHHEHAGGHHGRGMDQGRDRGRAFHRVRQPGVQQELRRLAHRAHEEQEADDGQRVEVPRQEMQLACRRCVGALAKMVSKSTELNRTKTREDAEREAEIADAVDDEGLDRRGVGRRPLVPEADQQIGGEADAFPAEEHLDEIVGRHQHQHGEGEQRQIGEEARPVRVVRHVADRIDVDERRDGGHHHQHDRRQRVDAERPVDGQRPGTEPVEDRDAVRHVLAEADGEERDPGEKRRDDEEARGDDLGRPRPESRRLVPAVAVIGLAVVLGIVAMGVVRVGMAVDRHGHPARRRGCAGARRRARSAPAMRAPSSGRKTMA